MADIELYKGKYTGSEVDEFLRRIDNGVIISQSDKERYDAYATEISDMKNSINCIGEIKAVLCSANYIPDGCVLCDGQEYNKTDKQDYDGTDYQQLWTNYLGNGDISKARLKCCSYDEYNQDIRDYGQCAKIGINQSAGTFRVPTIKDGSVIQQANSNGELGKSYNAGLPNITGSFDLWKFIETNGVFSFTRAVTNSNSHDGGDDPRYTVTFDASRSSSIYGRSNTVQPQAVAVRYFIALYNGVYNESKLNLAEMMAKLDYKANLDLNNISDNGKDVIKTLAKTVAFGIPNYGAGVSFGHGEQYSTSAGGWIYIHLVRWSNGSGSATLTINGTSFTMLSNDYADQYVWFPVPANSSYKVVNNGGLSELNLTWYPCL